MSAAESLIHCFKSLPVILIALFFIFSCSDQGCIEADDFGEYDTQTLEVTSNNAADNCTYDVSKSLSDASQGSGLKTCFISGSVTIYDENNDSQTSSTGCMGLVSDKFKNLCADQCVSNCTANIGVGSADSAEPAWTSTSEKNGSQNGGVTVKPNAVIYIRAVGLVRLGDKLPFPDFFVSGDDFMPQSKTANWVSQNLDLKVGKAINVSFSGKLNDNSIINGGATKVGQVGSGPDATLNSNIYNASRRLVAYMIPAPNNYSTDPSQPTDQAQFVNVPLLPDVNLWQCSYSNADLKQSACNNKSYKDNGYPNVDDVLTTSTFPLTSDLQSTTLGTYGGMVRWAGDGMQPDNFDPFAGIVCENPNCSTGISAVDPLQGALVGDLSAGDVTIVAPVSAKVSFRQLLLGTNAICDDTLQVVIRDANNNDLYYFDSTHGSLPVAVKSATWSSNYISVETGHKIIIRQKLSGSYSFANAAVSCDKSLVVRFGAYKDITINQSGFVSFAMLGGASNAGCNIKARIINPAKTRDSDVPKVTSDFYEYSDFATVGDPLDNLSIPAITQLSLWQSGAVNNGSQKFFVRKGQIIRFSPESWSGTWSAIGGARECGVGMAMRIEPRPALLCRGYGSTNVPNPGCLQKYNTTTGVLVGCDETSQECNDSTNATYFCPNQDVSTGCLKPITCTDGTNAGVSDHLPLPIPNNTRYDCTLGTRPTGCTIPTGGSATYTSQMCDNCSNLRLTRAQQSPYQSVSNIVQCYDLEAYKGKVSSIPITGFSTTDLADVNKAKGAVILGAFNGAYGNFAGFGGASSVDNTYSKNVIYQVTQPLNITQSGRLKFMFLDGTDFYQQAGVGYSDNTASDVRYNGSNGFKISLSSALEFTNGEWLEAKLCQELSTDSLSCKEVVLNADAIMSDQPKIVELNSPTGTGLLPVSNTPFYFDASGNLIRTKAAGAADCVGVLVNDTYYCHTNTTVDSSKIRLTFKIKDPEAATCDTNDPTNTAPVSPNGILINNTQYRPSDCVVGNPTADSSVTKNGITVADANGDAVCSSNSASEGKTCALTDDDDSKNPAVVCSKQYRCVSKYANNSGKYDVTVRVKTPGSNISNIVGDVITPIVEVMDGSKDGTKIGQAERIYKLIIGDPRYQAILSICLVVMFTFYGFGYLIGVTEAGISDIVSKLIKIALIYLFVGPEGWTWFNSIVVKFFKNGTDYLAFLMASSFDNSTLLQNAIANSDFYDKSVLFSSVDNVFGIFFSSTVQKKISALLFASIFGWAYLLIIYYGMLLYVYAVANSVLLYLTSQVFISILFVLGPLFFVFTLFSQTKEMFDKWLSQLISFSLQQIFLLTTLAFFNMMMYEVIKMVLGYKICWDEVWTINIITRITLMSFWTIASLPPRVNAQSDAGNIGNPDGIPSFFTILFIWIIADLMLQFVTFMTDMAASISGGLKASSLGSGIKEAAQGMKKFAGARMGEVWDKTGGQAVKRLDQALFDSGELADKARAQRKQENAQNTAHKKAFADAGNKAVSDHKRKNGAELANMSKEDQEKMLTKVRDKAVMAEGKKRGLSEDETKKVQADKGFKYEGTNVFGAAFQAVKQGVTKGGTLRTSLADQKANTKFSGSEAKDALKNATDDGRKDFVKAVKTGEINVGKSGAEAFKSGAKTAATLGTVKAAKGIASAAKAIGKAVHDKEYDEARKQLVAEGTVPRMAAGTNSALPKEAKELIRARAALNKKQRGEEEKKMSSSNTAAKVEQLAAAYSQKESSVGDKNVRGEGVVSAMIGREKTTSMAWNRGEVQAKVKEERAAIAKTAAEDGWRQAFRNEGQAQDNYDKHSKKEKEIRGNDSWKKNVEDSKAAQEKANDPKASREERAGARERLAEIKADPEFAKQNKELKEAMVGKNESANAVQNFQKAQDKFAEQLTPEPVPKKKK